MTAATRTATARSTTVTTICTAGARADAVRRLYDAECALHAAHQSRLDEWIASAADRLHEAVVEYLAETARR